METKNKMCQSCGMPMKRDPQNGEFTYKTNDVKNFQEHCRKIMMDGGHNKFAAWLFTRGMKRLGRWKK